ncbi:phage tail assembly protein [Lysobacter sp. CA199]|uniref:phage tail assembly protein n=1 Tax=Lysobacter sp. CA199 TaxID=3455608 RepID=UPI003F8D485B
MTKASIPSAAPIDDGDGELNPNAITLNAPILRGDTKITAVTIRKPDAGECRGIALVDLLQMDVVALQTLLPRITSPSLSQHEANRLDIADLLQFGGKVASFLLPKGA